MTVKDPDRWEETEEPGVYRRRQADPTELGYPPENETFIPSDATASAIKLADEHGISLSNIVGTGKDGRITKTDVEAVL